LSTDHFPEYGTEFGNGYEYAVDYGFKNTLIRFSTYEFEDFVIKNNIDSLLINNMTVYNATMFNPLSIEPLILSMMEDIALVSMSFINVTD